MELTNGFLRNKTQSPNNKCQKSNNKQVPNAKFQETNFVKAAGNPVTQPPKRYDLEDRTLRFSKDMIQFVSGLPKTIANVEIGNNLFVLQVLLGQITLRQTKLLDGRTSL